MNAQIPPIEYTLTFTDGPDGVWQINAYHCQEAINSPSQITLDLATEDLPADLAELLGANCELSMEREGGEPQYCYGVVTGVDFLGRTDHLAMLRVHATSAFDLGEQRIHSRIWQDATVLDIVAEVLDELFVDHGRTYQIDGLTRGKHPRTYCAQYRETDHDFVCRLLEEEGISFYFKHDPDAGHEVLVLCDDNSQYPDAVNFDGTSEFPLIATNASLARVESLQDVDWFLRSTTTSVLRRDFEWQAPNDLITSKLQGDPDGRGRVRRIYLHGERRFARDDLDERAGDLFAALALAGSTVRAVSNGLGLRPGLRFTADAHITDGAPDEYIVLSISHQGSGATSGGNGGGNDYSSVIDCVPATRTIRPLPATPKPRTQGPQTATVVGGGEIHTDEFGRIQVQFHWEETPSYAETASCWIRCAQSWASGGWGAQFIPRVGMEVLVEFLDGNPDRPLVTGCVYNGAHAPPFELPANATQSGWRTNSSPGGGGSNELRFDDAAGAEEIYIHGQKDWNVEIDNNHTESIGVDQTASIGNDRTETVGNNHSETIGVDKAIAVGANHDETIGAAMTLMVGTDQTITIGANQTVSIAANHTESIGANRTETIGACATETVGAIKTVTVGAAMIVSVGAAMNLAVGGLSAEEVGGIKTVSVGASNSVSVTGSRAVSAASITETADKTIAWTAGTDASATAKKKFTIDAGDEFTITCGKAKFSMKKSGDIVLEGEKITIKATGDVKIDAKGNIVLKGKKIGSN